MEKQVNYTPEMTQDLVARYTAGMPVDMIARELGKSVRSIVAKLVREGVYVAKTTTPTEKFTKVDFIKAIADGIGVDFASLDSLEKCNKTQLELLATHFKRVA